ncbi:hypothetical protein GDO78_023227 [Eleutherodactylus coqui]|uniref:Uncharacterized protein n=1 Tax=Eleutherodactylus coqui TaxID=57060 RepID=A0A8J6C4D7_ELECQ|nr:hypothetical protein GDO78_023227 [Eleutherodactylus coqui]
MQALQAFMVQLLQCLPRVHFPIFASLILSQATDLKLLKGELLVDHSILELETERSSKLAATVDSLNTAIKDNFTISEESSSAERASDNTGGS